MYATCTLICFVGLRAPPVAGVGIVFETLNVVRGNRGRVFIKSIVSGGPAEVSGYCLAFFGS